MPAVCMPTAAAARAPRRRCLRPTITTHPQSHPLPPTHPCRPQVRVGRHDAHHVWLRLRHRLLRVGHAHRQGHAGGRCAGLRGRGRAARRRPRGGPRVAAPRPGPCSCTPAAHSSHASLPPLTSTPSRTLPPVLRRARQPGQAAALRHERRRGRGDGQAGEGAWAPAGAGRERARAGWGGCARRRRRLPAARLPGPAWRWLAPDPAPVPPPCLPPQVGPKLPPVELNPDGSLNYESVSR